MKKFNLAFLPHLFWESVSPWCQPSMWVPGRKYSDGRRYGFIRGHYRSYRTRRLRRECDHRGKGPAHRQLAQEQPRGHGKHNHLGRPRGTERDLQEPKRVGPRKRDQFKPQPFSLYHGSGSERDQPRKCEYPASRRAVQSLGQAQFHPDENLDRVFRFEAKLLRRAG